MKKKSGVSKYVGSTVRAAPTRPLEKRRAQPASASTEKPGGEDQTQLEISRNQKTIKLRAKTNEMEQHKAKNAYNNETKI